MRSVFLTWVIACFIFSCNTSTRSNAVDTDKTFAAFENNFLDAYWRQYPSQSIFIGYGKYYDHLVVPDSAAYAADIAFCDQWTDSLNKMEYSKLSDNNKISFNIIRNQLASDKWYRSVFKQQEWDPSLFNISGECYYIISQPWAPLDERLRILSKRLQNADAYYAAAFKTLRNPTKEHTGMAASQNEGGLSVFGKSLTDSINASHLTVAEKDALNANVTKAVTAIKGYIASLQQVLADKNYSFRNYRIGKKLFEEKFTYDLATDFTPQQIYDRAVADKKMYYDHMYHLADSMWPKYYASQPKPKDTLTIIRSVIDKISLQHPAAEHFFDSLVSQVYQLKKFVVEKKLFDFDTTYPIKVRLMPEYARGVAAASADFTPPYQKQGDTYYNIDDIAAYPPEKRKGALEEENNWASQILSIHEAVPGHCMQGIYNNKKSPDVLRSVFQNGTMIEGWAVYTEQMMIENGWDNYSGEIQMMQDKWKLRELANVILDYDIQCLDKPKEEIVQLLTKDCFQTMAQAEEKWHRATVSQVQLCSYYSGYLSIMALRDEYKKKMGDKYSLKDFHEKFLSFGSSPVKYIRERMLH
jgi:uncharacterized protein (DUF885 family)